MGNQCCAFKGNKNKADDAYSRTSNEHMSIEKMAEDRIKKTTSSSASHSEIRIKEDEKSEDKSHDEVSKEEAERAGGGGGETSEINEVDTVVGHILCDTPKRPPMGMENAEEEETGEMETARIEGNGESPILVNTTPIILDEFGEEDDIVGEIVPSTYDLRPIRPLPTPLRMVDITPTRRIEMLCDERGRVRRNEKITRYLDDKRKSYENNTN